MNLAGRFTVTITPDGTAIAVDRETGLSASARTAEEALAELRRLILAAQQRERAA